MPERCAIEPNVEVTRVLNPNDANALGKVHGGTILQLIEEAGYIVSYKHCNKDGHSERKIFPLLCRIERTTFLMEIDIEEVAIVKATIQLSTDKTLCVKVDVFADNLLSGKQQLKCTSILWYCGTVIDNSVRKVTSVAVPQVVCADSGLEKLLRDNAQKNKENRKNFQQFEKHLIESLHSTPVEIRFPTLSPVNSTNGSEQSRTVAASTSISYHMVTRSECTLSGILTGGCLLKKMDELGAISAFKHSQNLVVTGCLEAVEFHAPTHHGTLLLIVARVVFCSKRTIDVDVVAIEEDPFENRGSPRLICSSFFTYVTIASPQSPLKEIPQLILSTEEEKQRFAEGEKRYLNRKKS